MAFSISRRHATDGNTTYRTVYDVVVIIGCLASLQKRFHMEILLFAGLRRCNSFNAPKQLARTSRIIGIISFVPFRFYAVHNLQTNSL